MTEPTPEAGRLRQLGQCAVELRVGENIYYCTLEPHEHNWHQFSLDADALAALTTQAETIRRLEGVVANHEEAHRVGLANERQWKQRAEAAEGRVRALSEALGEIMPRYREMFEHLGLGDFTQSVAYDIVMNALTSSPAPGEGA